MFKRSFLIFFLIFVCKCSEDFESLCFEILGSSGKFVSLKKNKEIKFIPNTLKIKTTIIVIYVNESTSTHESIIFARKIERECDESLSIPNFKEKNTTWIVITIDIFWKNYQIESFEIQLSPYTPGSYVFRDFKGYNNTLRLNIYSSAHIKTFSHYSPDIIRWTKMLNNIEYKYDMCMRVMKISGEYLFKLDYNLIDFNYHMIDKFYTLTIMAFEDKECTKKFYQQEYIAEIYQCLKNTSYFKMNINVNQFTKGIEIYLTTYDYGNNFKLRFVNENNIFVPSSLFGYDSNLLDIQIHRHFEEEQRKERFILYPKITNIQDCRFEKENKILYHHITKYFGKSYLDESEVWGFDMKNLIYYYRKPTEDELKKCPAKLF